MTRLLSHTEVAAALDCHAAWDFKYGGHLAGAVLKSKNTAPILQGGRAWGRAVATWHELAGSGAFPELALDEARGSIWLSLEHDAKRMKDWGFYDALARDSLETSLNAILTHYVATVEPMRLERAEAELIVPIPSRTGKRRSNRYAFQCFIDGLTYDEYDRPLLVEFKLRTQLLPSWLIERSRQPRWYSWGWRESTEITPHGIIVEERLKECPKPPRLVKAKRKAEGIDGMVPSHAKDQLCTVEDYLELCRSYDVEPSEEAVENMRQRRWQQRVPIEFRADELEEVGHEMVSAALLIQQLDSGKLYPIRNATKQHCGRCDFKDICPTPNDTFLVDSLFERKPPKRDRQAQSTPIAA